MDANVLDVYHMSPNKSLLNNVLRSKVLKRPVYATSTKGSTTQIWRIEAHGALVRIAVVNWSARSVTVGEVEQRLEDAVVKSKGLFQSESRIASIGNTRVKLQTILGEQWHEAWRCTILKQRSRTTRSNEEGASYSATFVPPQSCLKASELHLYGPTSATTRSDPGNEPQRVNHTPQETIDNIIICCILVTAGRDEYKTVQRSSPPSTGKGRPCGAASPIQPDTRSSLSQLLTLSFCIEDIHVPHHLMEIQRQLYTLNVAAGSAIALPPYQNQNTVEVHRTLVYGAIDNITTCCSPPAYS